MAPRADPDRYEPLPGVLELPGYLARRLSRRGRRTAAVLGLVLAAALAAGLAFGLPALLEARRDRAAAEERAAARARAGRIAALRAEVRRVDGRGTPARGLAGGAALTARHALAADLVAAVQADAAARADSGELAHPPLRVECSRYPPGAHAEDPAADLGSARGRYACLAVTAEIAPQESTRGGAIGYPYRALVRFRSGRYSFCKISGRPGEGALRAAVEVTVPPACGG